MRLHISGWHCSVATCPIRICYQTLSPLFLSGQARHSFGGDSGSSVCQKLRCTPKRYIIVTQTTLDYRVSVNATDRGFCTSKKLAKETKNLESPLPRCEHKQQHAENDDRERYKNKHGKKNTERNIFLLFALINFASRITTTTFNSLFFPEQSPDTRSLPSMIGTIHRST